MADQAKITLKNDREVKRAIKRLGDNLPKAAESAMRQSMLFLHRQTVAKKLSGQVLKRQTGRLASSMNSKVYKQGRGVVGIIGSNVKYARIHEFGGTIVPKNGPFLVFRIGDRVIKTKKVTIPARPYMGPTFRENKSRVKEIFKRSLIKWKDEAKN